MENDTAEDGGLHVTAFPFTLLRPYRSTPPAAPAEAHGTANERQGEPSPSRRYAV